MEQRLRPVSVRSSRVEVPEAVVGWRALEGSNLRGVALSHFRTFISNLSQHTNNRILLSPDAQYDDSPEQRPYSWRANKYLGPDNPLHRLERSL